MPKKWVEVYDQSGSTDDTYNTNKQIKFKASMLRSDLCDYSDAYIDVKLPLMGLLMLIKEIKVLHLKTMLRLFLYFKN